MQWIRFYEFLQVEPENANQPSVIFSGIQDLGYFSFKLCHLKNMTSLYFPRYHYLGRGHGKKIKEQLQGN